jgi:hypothetical protein
MNQDILYAHGLNRFWSEHSRNDEKMESFVNSIRTGRIDVLVLDERPVEEEFGRRVAQAFTSNARITRMLLLHQVGNGGVQGVIQWLTTSTAGEPPTATLVLSRTLRRWLCMMVLVVIVISP